MKIVLVSAAWRRFDVTRLALAQRAHLRSVLAERGLEVEAVIVADDENIEIAHEFDFWAIEQSNEFIGRKFNDGIEFACTWLDADFVVLIGSDDWVHPDMFDVLPRERAHLPLPTPERPVVIGRPGPEAVTGKRIAFVDLIRERVQPCEVQGRLGVIPWIVPARALEASKFRPITETCNRGIDGSFYRGLKVRPEFVWHDSHPLARVDFKSNINLNPYDKIVSHIAVGSSFEGFDVLRMYYPDALVDQAEEVSRSLVYSF